MMLVDMFDLTCPDIGGDIHSQPAAALEASTSFYHLATDAWNVRAPNWCWLGIL
jgi:hypothetical protein